MCVTLDELLREESATLSIDEINVQFESIMFDLADLAMESAELDEMSNTLNAASSVVMEDGTEKQKSTIGEKLKMVLQAIVKFILKLLTGLMSVIRMPITFIEHLIQSGSLKFAIKACKFDFKSAIELGDIIGDAIFKQTPSAERIQKRRELLSEMYKACAEYRSQMMSTFARLFQSADSDAGGYYSGSYNSSNSSGMDDPHDEFTDKIKQFREQYKSETAGAPDPSTLAEAFEYVEKTAAANKAENHKHRTQMAEMEAYIKRLEKIIGQNGENLKNLDPKEQERFKRILDHLKLYVVQISDIEREEAMEMKAIFDAANMIAKKSKK